MVQNTRSMVVHADVPEFGVRAGDRIYVMVSEQTGELTVRLVRGCTGKDAERYLEDLNRALNRPEVRSCPPGETSVGHS